MSFDMSQFHQVFFEEAGEHLANMENLLLALDLGNPDGEQLNAIFRAAHSIKGSSGTFGFTDMQDVTHILESLLDAVRKGRLRMHEDMVDAMLAAGDVLKNLLAAHQNKGEADLAAAAAIRQRLQRLAEQVSEPGAAVTATSGAQPAVPPAPTFAAGAPGAGFEIYFVIDGDPVLVERTVAILKDELATHGEIVCAEPPGAADQPWHIRLVGKANPDELRGMLEFIARSDSIRIEPLGLTMMLLDAPDGAYGFFHAPGVATAEAAPADWDVLPEIALPLPVDEPFEFLAPLPEMRPAPAEDGLYGDYDFSAHPAAEIVAPTVADAEAPASAEATPHLVPAAIKPVQAETTIRVGVDKVDQLINLVGELVITQAMLAQTAARLDPVEFESLYSGLIQLERNTRDLQDAAMSMRMLPMSVVFSRFPRVVRDLSQKLGKQVELKLAGENTQLDKGLIERIADPLTHLVRNSLDHGIEPPAVRAGKGKPPLGTITLSAWHQGGNVVVEVDDDGGGLNRQKILAKARERGFNVSDQMSDQDVFALIFEAGFSTADQVTEVSGRGVGMDVVKKNITALGGRLEIDSRPDVGTRMTVRLPLTLAILDGMSVAVGQETYIIPLAYVVESLQAGPGMIKSVSGAERLVQVRDEYLPIMSLRELFRIPGALAEFTEGIMVILEAAGVKAALFVDALVGQHQVVIKSLEANFRKVPGVAGATIMGDGRVALILDVPMLVDQARTALPAAA